MASLLDQKYPFLTSVPTAAGALSEGLGGLVSSTEPGLSALLSPPAPLGGLVPTTRNSGLGLGMLAPELPRSALAALFAPVETKRKVYFAFRHRDIMRVNNVRNAWCIDHPDSSLNRSFYDRSIWDSSAATTDEGLKDLMRRGVEFSSAVCVLVGTDTWWSRWVRYEIARSVIDERGLLAVHINGLNHVRTQQPSPHGYNPLNCLGIYHSPGGKYFLAQKVMTLPGIGNFMRTSRVLSHFRDTFPRFREGTLSHCQTMCLNMTTSPRQATRISARGLIARQSQSDDRRPRRLLSPHHIPSHGDHSSWARPSGSCSKVASWACMRLASF
jgi:MTH538 TIR-like domain (DUF1863)